MTRKAGLAGIAMSGHPLARGVRGYEAGPVGGAGGAAADPGFGAALVAGHALGRGPAHGLAVAQHARCGRPGESMPPVEDDWATGHTAGSVGHAKISCSS